ncbi:MAG: signal peptidase I [Thaumarchaeota archaeon]|nr:signal peptidase I [Nitrososphaerota archaeon]
MDFEAWWEENKEWYMENGINKEDFETSSFRNGFNKGDIMVLVGKDAENIEVGNVIVFRSSKRDPIIHRVVKKFEDDKGIYFQTKGDNNEDSIKNDALDETNIREDVIIGKAVLRVPFLGYIKIGFVEALKFLDLA